MSIPHSNSARFLNQYMFCQAWVILSSFQEGAFSLLENCQQFFTQSIFYNYVADYLYDKYDNMVMPAVVSPWSANSFDIFN